MAAPQEKVADAAFVRARRGSTRRSAPTARRRRPGRRPGRAARRPPATRRGTDTGGGMRAALSRRSGDPIRRRAARARPALPPIRPVRPPRIGGSGRAHAEVADAHGLLQRPLRRGTATRARRSTRPAPGPSCAAPRSGAGGGRPRPPCAASRRRRPGRPGRCRSGPRGPDRQRSVGRTLSSVAPTWGVSRRTLRIGRRMPGARRGSTTKASVAGGPELPARSVWRASNTYEPEAQAARRHVAGRDAGGALHERAAGAQHAPGDDGPRLEPAPRVAGRVARVALGGGPAQRQRAGRRGVDREPVRGRRPLDPHEIPLRDAELVAPVRERRRHDLARWRSAPRPSAPASRRGSGSTSARDTRPPLQVKAGVGVRVIAGGAPVIVGGPGEVATRMKRRVGRDGVAVPVLAVARPRTNQRSRVSSGRATVAVELALRVVDERGVGHLERPRRELDVDLVAASARPPPAAS